MGPLTRRTVLIAGDARGLARLPQALIDGVDVDQTSVSDKSVRR